MHVKKSVFKLFFHQHMLGMFIFLLACSIFATYKNYELNAGEQLNKLQIKLQW